MAIPGEIMNDWERGELIELDEEFRRMGYYMTTPVKDRMKAMRERRAKEGLVQLNLTVHKDDKEAVRAYAEKLRKDREA